MFKQICRSLHYANLPTTYYPEIFFSMRAKHHTYTISSLFALLTILSACIDEPYLNQRTDESFITVKKTKTYEGTHPGTSEDYVVENLRILAFDKTTGQCKSNVYYNASKEDIIQHTIETGTYDFIFLANTPPYVNITNKLDTISNYASLNYIAYPADAFISERIIPMIQEVKNVTVQSNGKGIILNETTTHANILELKLNRMAVRVDVVLESDNNFDGEFKGVSFSNLPDKVPLTSNYKGEAINRNVIRTFTVADNGNYFSTPTRETSQPTWSKKITRVILPSNSSIKSDNTTDAVTFTVNMHDLYSPSCLLKTTTNPDNYSLPNNTKLDLTAIIKEPLHVNIVASQWQDIDNNWNIAPIRILNVSHTEVNITDFNGARISFWSNMPVVRIDSVTIRKRDGQKLETNKIFNALASQYYRPNSDERFYYSPSQGAGYMDILIDEPNIIGSETYEITLVAAENIGGLNSLKKVIHVHVKQEGTRNTFIANSNENQWSNPYVGAFFRNDEVGERVISGNRYSYWHTWTAEIPDQYKDFIKLSTTPSFDPDIGTNTPGDPENYPVTPNLHKGENGQKVTGRGRIYFRVGLYDKWTSEQPRYGKVYITYQNSTNGQITNHQTTLYVRQGENPDYLMRSGSSGNNFGKKFAAFNLTATTFKTNPNTTSEWIDFDFSNRHNEIDFVDYPSQSGAFFQWGFPIKNADLAYRAYHPTNCNLQNSNWSISSWNNSYHFTTYPFWNPSTGDKMAEYYEISPNGFERPSDGPTDQIATNSGSNENVYQSAWRMSLFTSLMKGNASSDTYLYPYDQNYKTEIYTPVILDNLIYGNYADGFFDRRPIQSGQMIDGTNREATNNTTQYTGVSIHNASAAFRGVLIFNPNTDASLFLPAAGRRSNPDGSLEFAGQTGYYWSSSVAPGWSKIENDVEKGVILGNIWSMEFNYPTTKPVAVIYTFGLSIRCVKK